MNTEKLINAAKRIELVGIKQDEYLKACQQFAIDMQADKLSVDEIGKRKQELSKIRNTFSFEVGIMELRKALRELEESQTPECGFFFDENQRFFL